MRKIPFGTFSDEFFYEFLFLLIVKSAMYLSNKYQIVIAILYYIGSYLHIRTFSIYCRDYYFLFYFLSIFRIWWIFLLLQAEISKRLNVIIAQILPYLSQDHQQQVHTAVKRAEAVSMPEITSMIVSIYANVTQRRMCIYPQNWPINYSRTFSKGVNLLMFSTFFLSITIFCNCYLEPENFCNCYLEPRTLFVIS